MCLAQALPVLAATGATVASGGTLGPAALAALGGTAASGVGNYMTQQENNQNANRVYNAQKDAAAQGAAQQAANAAKGAGIVNSAVSQFTPSAQAADLGNIIADRSKVINDNTAQPPSLVTAASTAPGAVQNDFANRLASTAAYNSSQGDALAKMGATDTQGINNALALNTAGNQIGTLNNFAQGDQRVTGINIKAAGNNARKAANPFWQDLATAGNVASMAGAASGGLGSLTGAANTAGYGSVGDWLTGAMGGAPQTAAQQLTSATTGTGGLY